MTDYKTGDYVVARPGIRARVLEVLSDGTLRLVTADLQDAGTRFVASPASVTPERVDAPTLSAADLKGPTFRETDGGRAMRHCACLSCVPSRYMTTEGEVCVQLRLRSQARLMLSRAEGR